jgi:hypothetical protein
MSSSDREAVLSAVTDAGSDGVDRESAAVKMRRFRARRRLASVIKAEERLGL